MDNIESKPPSDILPEAREYPPELDTENVMKLCGNYWTHFGAKSDTNYNKGLEIGKNYIQQDDLTYNLVLGLIKSVFEEVKSQVNKNENLTFEKRQRDLHRVNIIHSGIINQIEMLKLLNIKLDSILLQAILHGYTTAFLFLKNYDYKD